MFELINSGKKDYFNICIDGVTYLYSQVHDIEDPSQFDSTDKEVSQELIKYKLSDFGKFEYITLENVFDWVDFKHSVHISFNYEFFEELGNLKEKETGKIDVVFSFEPNLLLWKKEFSFSEYFKEFEVLWKETNLLQGELNLYEFEDIGLDIKITVPKFLFSIDNSLSPYIEELKKIHEKAFFNLESKLHKDSLSTIFKFPAEIKTSCEQYLLYFARFLRDLGINATPNLKEEAGKVLFSVTPTDDVEALDKIREALAIYLKLPESPISDIEYSENFALMRLQQQVRNLQHSQQMAKTEILSAQYAFSLAQQNIENQDRIIVRQNSLIENLDKVIEKITSNSIMIDSAEKKEVKEEFEEIYEGVRVGESKWLRELTGIGLNPAKVIKTTVKNTFGKDGENKSVLGLDEESN